MKIIYVNAVIFMQTNKITLCSHKKRNACDPQ